MPSSTCNSPRRRSLREYAVDKFLELLFGDSRWPLERPHLEVVSIHVGDLPPHKNMATKVSLYTEQFIDIGIEYRDGRKSSVKVDGAPRWSVEDGGTNITVKNSNDGFTGRIVSGKNPTTTPEIVRVRADADLGDGQEELVHDIEVTVLPRRASSAVATELGGAQDLPDDGTEIGIPEDRPEGDAPRSPVTERARG